MVKPVFCIVDTGSCCLYLCFNPCLFTHTFGFSVLVATIMPPNLNTITSFHLSPNCHQCLTCFHWIISSQHNFISEFLFLFDNFFSKYYNFRVLTATIASLVLSFASRRHLFVLSSLLVRTICHHLSDICKFFSMLVRKNRQ